jgi:hypothetical protein
MVLGLSRSWSHMALPARRTLSRRRRDAVREGPATTATPSRLGITGSRRRPGAVQLHCSILMPLPDVVLWGLSTAGQGPAMYHSICSVGCTTPHLASLALQSAAPGLMALAGPADPLLCGDPNQVFSIFSHFQVFSLSDLCCFGGGLPRPQSVRAHARTRGHLILLLCSTEIQSVWSVHSTVPHVSKFLRMITDIGSHSCLFRPT